MATRTIPNDVQPLWSCTINGKKYSYKAGATVDVPDEVADLIDSLAAAGQRPEQQYIPTLPVIGPEDDGKVVKAVGRRYVLAEEEGGSGGMVESNCALHIDTETGTQTIATDMTAAELFGACAAGKQVLAAIAMPTSEEAIVIQKTLSISGQVLGDDEEAVYEFCFSTVSQEEGLIGFLAADLSADDTVVFTKV